MDNISLAGQDLLLTTHGGLQPVDARTGVRPPARPLDPAAVLERMPDGLNLDDAAMPVFSSPFHPNPVSPVSAPVFQPF